MIGDAQFQMLRQLYSSAQGALHGERVERSGVADLRNVVPEEKARFVKEIDVLKRSAGKGLDFDVTTKGPAREGGASVRLAAAAKVRLVVGRRDGEFRIAANKIFGE